MAICIALSTFLLINFPCNLKKNVSTQFASQSWRFHEKHEFQCPPSPICSHTSTTQAAFEVAIVNNNGKEIFKDVFEHHVSFQNFTLLPLPLIKQILLLKAPHPFLIAFHNPTPYRFLASKAHQPLSSSPNFPIITCFQKDSLSDINLQHHLLRRA